MRNTTRFRYIAAFLFPLVAQLFVLLCGGIYAASPAVTPAVAGTVVVKPVRQSELDAARQALSSDATLNDTQKQQAQDLVRQAAEDLAQTRQASTALTRLQQRIAGAPRQITRLQRQLQWPAKTPPAIPDDTSLNQLQLQLSQQKAALSDAEDQLNQVGARLNMLRTGAKGIGDRIAEDSQHLSQIKTDLQASAADTPPALRQAQHLALRARHALRSREREQLQLQLGNLNLLTTLAQARHDLLTAQVAAGRKHQSALIAAIQERRERQARAAVKRAEALQTQAADLPPALQQIAAANARYRKELQTLVASGQDLDQRIQQTQRQARSVTAQFERSRQRVESIGLTQAVGRMLRRRLATLPSGAGLNFGADRETERMDQATERQIEIEDLQQDLGEPDDSVDRVMRQLPRTLSTRQRKHLRKEAVKLAQARQQALNELNTRYGQTIGKLAQLRLARQQLATQATLFADFIDKQLVWIPGSGLSPLTDPASWKDIVHWIDAPARWRALFDDLGRLMARHSFEMGLLLAVITLLLLSRRHADRRLAAIGRDTRRIRNDSFWLTLEALWITLALAAPLALLLVAPALQLLHQGSGHAFTLAMAGATLNVGIMVGVIQLLRALCREEGLGQRHLQWPTPMRKSLLRETRWVLPTILLPGLVVGATYHGSTPESVQTLGQIAFIVLMAIIAVAVVRLFGGRSSISHFLREHRPDGWLTRSQFLWYPLLLLLPLALAVTTLANHYFAALAFAVRLRMTIWLVLGLLLVRDLLLRWFYITERRLLLSEAIRRREAAEQDNSEPVVEGDSGPQDRVEDQQPDYSQLSDQSRRLVQATFAFGALFGVWSIWVDLVPLLGFLNQVALPFHAERLVDGVAKQTPVTLADLLMALFLLLVVIIAARNLPGLLEMVLLRRLPLTPGSRFAITSLSQYLIVGIGVFAAFAAIGLQWSSIQWLVAALGVGVGFGLQEIVANFISGVILLFEQPIRVGDVVTVDDTTGTVTRLRIRATTITNWDRQELLVPNKEFITGRVLNWTLSSDINRRIISVGVAYGSDVARAMKLMIEAAREHPEVLEDPPPFASFEAFGDNALTLRLRAYMSNMDRRLGITSELYQGIYKRFNEAGIVIAFPQLDLHLDPGVSASTGDGDDKVGAAH